MQFMVGGKILPLSYVYSLVRARKVVCIFLQTDKNLLLYVLPSDQIYVILYLAPKLSGTPYKHTTWYMVHGLPP